MEKRIARIARWLNRCAEACSARSWQSALMDMECAKAELEEARRYLWARAEGRQQPFNAAWRAARAWTSALGLPRDGVGQRAGGACLGKHRERASALMESSSSLEWVSTDEKALLTVLRSAPLAMPILPVFRPSRRCACEGSLFPRKREPGPIQAKPSLRRKSSETSDLFHDGREFDTIINLVQIGQRSLREREPPFDLMPCKKDFLDFRKERLWVTQNRKRTCLLMALLLAFLFSCGAASAADPVIAKADVEGNEHVITDHILGVALG